LSVCALPVVSLTVIIGAVYCITNRFVAFGNVFAECNFFDDVRLFSDDCRFSRRRYVNFADYDSSPQNV
jgi:hypothetical protein